LFGGAGNDFLNGGGGADAMSGGTNNDTYVVNDAGDTVTEAAGAGNDTVNASINHTLAAEVENLILTGVANLNGTGNGLANSITGNTGNNVLNGGAGTDTLFGGAGLDQLFGGTQADQLFGGSGNDVLGGGLGNDTLSGGLDADIFVFGTALNVVTNVDTITDYSVVDDTIHLDDAIFAGLGLGALLASAFRFGAAAVDADDRIIYQGSTGNLFYDVDGVGGVAQVQFATLTAGLAMSHSEFVVI
jgi:Ca2+-binding RTX toxin-like protein